MPAEGPAPAQGSTALRLPRPQRSRPPGSLWLSTASRPQGSMAVATRLCDGCTRPRGLVVAFAGLPQGSTAVATRALETIAPAWGQPGLAKADGPAPAGVDGRRHQRS